MKAANLVTSLVLRYLCSANYQDRKPAFDGLMACCWKAKGNMYVRPEEDGSDQDSIAYTSVSAWEKCSAVDGMNYPRKSWRWLVYDATRNFIRERLNTILDEYDDLLICEIEQLACDGQLKWIARRVRNDMANHLRKHYKQRRSEFGIDDAPDDKEATAATAETPHTAALALRRILDQRQSLCRLIGPRMFETMIAVVQNYPFGNNRRERKGNITRAIATTRGVSFQQARSDKRELAQCSEISQLVARTVERFAT